MRDVVKDLIVDRVRGVFNDRERGEQPVRRCDDGLFGPGSVAWRVHGDVTTMMVGGVSALLLQMLHPGVLAGVWDHSNFRRDMLGRLRRTARFIAVTTYGSREQAHAAIARVREVHRRVRGTMPDGTPYSAEDPALLAWVHVTETTSFLDAWIRYAEPTMPLADQDRYFAENAIVAQELGAGEVPTSRAGADGLIERMRPQLRADERTHEIARILLRPAQNLAVLPFQQLTNQAAIDLLPRWARQMLRLRPSRLSRPLVAGGTLGLRQTLRWAFR